MKKTEAECCEVTFVHDDIVRQIGTKMPEEELLKELADFYKVFGDSTRIKILCVLLEAEVCVCDLAEILGMTQSAISHQLRVLKQMKLVKNRRDGKTVYLGDYYQVTTGWAAARTAWWNMLQAVGTGDDVAAAVD